MMAGSSREPRTVRRTGAVRRAVTAWFALLAIVVQLSSAAACTAGDHALMFAADQGFPICHSQAGANDPASSRNDHRSPHQHDQCPFCSIHCHAALALAPTTGVASPMLLASSERVESLKVWLPPFRRHVGASPRGPPQRG